MLLLISDEEEVAIAIFEPAGTVIVLVVLEFRFDVDAVEEAVEFDGADEEAAVTVRTDPEADEEVVVISRRDDEAGDGEEEEETGG